MQTLEDLERVLTDIRRELSTFDASVWKDLPPGKLFFKYNQCNRPGCSCMTSDHRHGPYCYLQWTKNGKIHQRYVNRKLAKKILPALADRERYERLKADEYFYAHVIGFMKRSGLKPDNPDTEVAPNV